MNNNYNANMYLIKDNLNDIENSIDNITNEIREHIYDNNSSPLRNIEIGDNLGGKTLYLSLPRTIHENIPDADTYARAIVQTDANKYIAYKYINGYKYIGIIVPDPDNPNTNKIYYFYAYSTSNEFGNPYLNQVRFKLPKDFGKVTYTHSNNAIYPHIKILDESIIPNYEKHTWTDNELLTMQKIDNITQGVNNIGLYYEKPQGWVTEKEWMPNANKNYAGDYGVGIKTISYQDLNRWINNLNLINFDNLNEMTLWNAINNISQIEWDIDSDIDWIDNFELVKYNVITEDNNNLNTENGDNLIAIIDILDGR